MGNLKNVLKMFQDNPFTSIPKLGKEEAGREAFSESGLMIIRNNADGFIYPLFFFAVAIALREGDICTLKWNEIDHKKETIVKKMRKTGNYVEIPMIPPIRDYLQNLQSNIQSGSPYSEYVLPDHARMYLTNSSGVSYRIKQFLEKKCNIATTKIPDARSRAVSVKDLHSCRHTFCYYAGLYGIPLSVVQSIVGHMTPEMTKHYSAHASLEIKREKMKLLPAFLSLAAPENTEPDMTDNSDTTQNDLATKIKELPEEIEAELNALVNTIISSE